MNEDLNVSPSHTISNPTSINFKFNNGTIKTSIPASYAPVIIKLAEPEINNGNFILTENGTIKVPFSGIMNLIAYTYHSSTDCPASSFWRNTVIKNITKNGIDNNEDCANSMGNQTKGGTHQTTCGIMHVDAGDEIGIVCYNNNVSKMTVAKLSGFYISIE